MVHQKQEVTYPYAIAPDGTITGIEEAARGGEFQCPGCRQGMSTVQGDSLRWHYRHHQNVDPCSKDNALHITAQLLIQREFRRAVKERRRYSVSHPCSACRSPMGFLNIALPKARMILEDGEMVKGTRPDVTVKRNKLRVIIEVVVTHDLEEKTRRTYLKSKIPVYILRMTDFQDLEKIEGGVSTDESLNTDRNLRGVPSEEERQDGKTERGEEGSLQKEGRAEGQGETPPEDRGKDTHQYGTSQVRETAVHPLA